LKDKSIDVSGIDLNKVAEKPFPPSSRYRIFVSRKAHDAVWQHARDTLDEQKEVGGVLVGNVYKDEQGPFLEVTAAILGEHTRNEGTQVTFTHETWEQVNKVKDKEHPKARIVGWYHTHPRFGIFLSEMDVFIQKNFFSEPWQTAFVLDPVQRTEGFFIWSQGEPKLIDEYWVEQERRDRSFAKVAHDRDDATDAEESDEDSKGKPGYGAAVSRAAFALVVALGFLTLLFLSAYVYLREVAHSQAENVIMSVIQQQQIALLDSSQRLSDLKDKVDKASEQQGAQGQKVDEEIAVLQQRLGEMAVMSNLIREQLAGQHMVIQRLRRELSGTASQQRAVPTSSQ
jgi:proteasome lid subunit RPN8/RPN11